MTGKNAALNSTGTTLDMLGERSSVVVKWSPGKAAFMVDAIDRLPSNQRHAGFMEIGRDFQGHVVLAVRLSHEVMAEVAREYLDINGTLGLAQIVWVSLWDRLPDEAKDQAP